MLNGLGLYLRARHVPMTVSTIVIIAGVAALFGNLQIPVLSVEATQDYAATVVLSIAPVAIAVAVSFGLRGDFDVLNRQSVRPLSAPSAFCLILLLTVSCIALLPAVCVNDASDALPMTLENLMGSFALMLLIGCFLDPAHIWLGLFPLGMAGLLARPSAGSHLSGLLIVNSASGPGEMRRDGLLLVIAAALYLFIDGHRPLVHGLMRRTGIARRSSRWSR